MPSRSGEEHLNSSVPPAPRQAHCKIHKPHPHYLPASCGVCLRSIQKSLSTRFRKNLFLLNSGRTHPSPLHQERKSHPDSPYPLFSVLVRNWPIRGHGLSHKGQAPSWTAGAGVRDGSRAEVPSGNKATRRMKTAWHPPRKIECPDQTTRQSAHPPCCRRPVNTRRRIRTDPTEHHIGPENIRPCDRYSCQTARRRNTGRPFSASPRRNASRHAAIPSDALPDGIPS